MKKNLLKSIIFIIFLISYFIFPVQKANALCSGLSYYTDIRLNNANDAITWDVRAKYKANPISYSVPWATYIVSPNSTTYAMTINQYRATTNDSVEWYTACVDPVQGVTPSTDTSLCRVGEGIEYYDNISVGCAYGTDSTPGNKYAGCYNLDYNTTVRHVGYASQCPYYHYKDSYCTKSQCTAYPSLCRASYCGGTGSCTYYKKSCDGPQQSDCTYKTGATGCSYSVTHFSATCGASCDNGPTPTSSHTCVSPGRADIIISWNPIPYDSYYYVRYRYNGSSTWTNWSGNPVYANSITLRGTAATSYEAEVMAYSSDGDHTNWSSLTSGTIDCSGPNLTVSAFTFPSGSSGTTGNASVTVTNNGNESTVSGFTVKVQDGTTTNAWTGTTTALAAGASVTLDILVRRPITGGTYTAVATADSTNAITELDETDNTRTDSYTVTQSNLTVSAFTFPSGNSGTTGNASVTVANNGNQSTVNGFNVATIRNAPSADCTTDETNAAIDPLRVAKISTGALAAGGSSALSLSVTRPPNAGTYTAVAMADADCNIAESNETDNDRTDSYTVTSHISGCVFVDTDRSGTKNGTETCYNNSNGTARITINGANYYTSGNPISSYQSAELNAGTYTVALTVIPSLYEATTPTSVSKTLGPDAVVDFGIALKLYNVKAHVYVDFNGDGLQNNVGDPGYTGTIDEPDYAPPTYTPPANTISYSGAITGSAPTGAGGIYEITNIPPGNNNESIRVNPPATWTLTTANNIFVSGPLPFEQTVNFGIQPPAPTCTMTASPTTVNPAPPNNTSTLTVNAVKPATYNGNLTYNWYTDLGSVAPTVTTGPGPTSTSTWTAPNPYWISGTKAIPSAKVCTTGAGSTVDVCGNCQVDLSHQITIVPLHSISGFIYTDSNKDAKYVNPPESKYTASSLNITICPITGGGSTWFCPAMGGAAIPTVNGAFDTTRAGTLYNLTPGQYTVRLTNLPDPTYSFSGNSSYIITVGLPCPASEPSGSCNGTTGNVINVAFGINNSNVWYQSTGGDIYQSSGISNVEPAVSACGPHMSVSNPAVNIQMPGLIFTGNGTAYFGLGDASLNNWVVGKGLTYPNTITLPGATSYAAVTKKVTDAGVTITPLPCASGTPATGCTLSNSLASGVYKVTGDLKLTGTGNTYTFPGGGDYIFLISGKLDIQTEVHVPKGSFALFTASGDITVGGSIGSTYNATTSDIEGYYSSDQNFIAQGTNNCPTKDLRLNVAGAIITDANNNNSGSFQIKRDMCEDDVCPTFTVQARPDFVLNAPNYLLSPIRIWQEISP